MWAVLCQILSMQWKESRWLILLRISCLFFLLLLSVGRGFALGWSPFQKGLAVVVIKIPKERQEALDCTGLSCHAKIKIYSTGTEVCVYSVPLFPDACFSRIHQIVLYYTCFFIDRPPLWSSGQSSWLQIRRSGSIPGTTSVVVKALCYKPEGCKCNSRWGEFLNLPNPSSRTRPWGLLSL
jgi:hypothetical protein